MSGLLSYVFLKTHLNLKDNVGTSIMNTKKICCVMSLALDISLVGKEWFLTSAVILDIQQAYNDIIFYKEEVTNELEVHLKKNDQCCPWT